MVCHCEPLKKARQSRLNYRLSVIQWDCHSADNQLWRFVKSGDGYRIQSKLGYYLDVKDGSTENGTPVQLWSNNGTNAQLWYLKSVS